MPARFASLAHQTWCELCLNNLAILPVVREAKHFSDVERRLEQKLELHIPLLRDVTPGVHIQIS